MNTHLQRWARMSVAAGLVVGAVVVLRPVPRVREDPQAGRPECPHDWDAKRGQFEELTPIMNVPEFHDCQRFIVPDGNGALQYDSLYAIFAVAGLEGLEGRLDSTSYCASCARGAEQDRREPPSRGSIFRERATTLGVVAARIYAEGDYKPLGIRRMFDCLYLFRADTAWGAIMAPLPDGFRSCSRPIDPAVPWGTELVVVRHAASDTDTVPPVARWDWDGAHGIQFIGIACGRAWCEVGAPGFVSSEQPQLGIRTAGLLGQTGRIKGWYDEQFVSYVDTEGNVKPSRIRGRIFPAPGLGRFAAVDLRLPASTTHAFEEWTNTAYIVLDTVPAIASMSAETSAAVPPGVTDALHQYKAHLNLDARRNATDSIRLDDLNRLEVCHGSVDDCLIGPSGQQDLVGCGTEGQWWARIIAAGGRAPKYLCVTRRGHETLSRFSVLGTISFSVPGTARWRWMASDEGIWHACGQGCCESLGGPG